MKLVIGIRSRILLTAAISAFVLTTMASFVMVETFLRLILEESTKRLWSILMQGLAIRIRPAGQRAYPEFREKSFRKSMCTRLMNPVVAFYIATRCFSPAGSWSDCLIPRAPPPTCVINEGNEPATYVLRRLGGDHFCRSFLFVFGENHRMRRTVEGLLFSLSCVASAFVVLIMWFFVIRPVVRRLSGLRANAQQVGGTEVYRSRFDLSRR